MKKHNKKTPTGKITTIEQVNQRRAEAEARCSARRTAALKKAGATDEQIEQLFEQEKARTILCIYYGSYTVNLGEQEVEVKKYNKEKKCFEPTTVTKEVILRGRKAAEYTIREKELDVIVYRPTHCYIKTTADKAEEIAADLRKIGRCYITKHKRLPAKEEVENLNLKPEKVKKPSYNTSERKKAAKAKRKAENMKKAEMRAFYAAKRKGGVCARIKKFNKTLADKIEKWLDEQKKKPEKKDSWERRASKHQLTSIEIKKNKRARKIMKRQDTLERIQERQKKRAAINAKLKAERAQKAQKPVQTELKMAA